MKHSGRAEHAAAHAAQWSQLLIQAKMSRTLAQCLMCRQVSLGVRYSDLKYRPGPPGLGTCPCRRPSRFPPCTRPRSGSSSSRRPSCCSAARSSLPPCTAHHADVRCFPGCPLLCSKFVRFAGNCGLKLIIRVALLHNVVHCRCYAAVCATALTGLIFMVGLNNHAALMTLRSCSPELEGHAALRQLVDVQSFQDALPHHHSTS